MGWMTNRDPQLKGQNVETLDWLDHNIQQVGGYGEGIGHVFGQINP